MSRTLWRSLRARIFLLAIVTCVFLAIAVGSFYSSIRSSHRSVLSEKSRHLSHVASDLSKVFSSQASHGLSLRDPSSSTEAPAPPPSPPAIETESKVPLPPPRVDPFSELTANVLRKQEGIEGGFLAGAGPLVGYAFPTHEGPGRQKEMPERERPTIEQLARKAQETGSAQNYVFEGPHDVVIFTAEPVKEDVAGTPQITGAVWLMQRLPDINRGGSKQLLFASLGFGAAALVTAFLAWFVTVEVRGGVNAVTARLGALEKELTPHVDASERPQLAEFERVLTGISAMAVSLERRITNERNLEEQLRHKERLSSLGQFAAGVAHELRNPLATIRLRAEMSQCTSGEGSIARNSSVILEEVDRLNSMIARLLYFARPISLVLQTMDVSELCSSVVQSWRARAPEIVSLSCHVKPGVQIVADRSRLLQVLDNLVENAIQASLAAPSAVIIQAKEQAHSVQIDVVDRGTGFTSDALKHAFDPFYTTKEAGTGLGLSIAFELIEAHGGEMTASSLPEGGAIVSIVLPRPAQPEEVRS